MRLQYDVQVPKRVLLAVPVNLEDFEDPVDCSLSISAPDGRTRMCILENQSSVPWIICCMSCFAGIALLCLEEGTVELWNTMVGYPPAL